MKAVNIDKELVVLAHGILRDGKDMLFIENGLKKLGYDTLAVHLPLTFGSLEDACNSLTKQIHSLIKCYPCVHFVGYSMGGLVIQKFLSVNPIKNLGNCIFIASPHRGSKLADIAVRFPGVARVFKPLKDLRTNREIDNFFHIHKTTKIGIIAGNKNNIFYSKLFMSSNSDGMVELSSAKLDDMHDIKYFSYGHQEIHYQQEVLDSVATFLKLGRFA